jgi:diguanylate cyclase (GGDEF)-like protein
VDFSAEWYNQQLAGLAGTTIIVAVLSLLIGGGIVTAIATKRQKQIGSIQGRLNDMAATLMHEMGNNPTEEEGSPVPLAPSSADSMDLLEDQIQSMQTELQTQIAQVHGHAYQDGLTGVKSKRAFANAEMALDQKLADGTLSEFGLVVCDVNGLKIVNDTKGHKAGDEYIRQACKMICDIFIHSPVYRVGGDEFAVILTGRDYENREVLMYRLHARSLAHIATEDAVVSGGLAEYDPKSDRSIREVFDRADATMYKEKMLLKSLGAATREDELERVTWNASYGGGLPSNNVRRHLLISDDVESNREILGDPLMEDYDVFYAADGVETMEVLQSHKDEIDLVLLDLFMPNMSGREVLMQMQVNEELASIPVIVLTVDEDAQIDCLKYGAMDFIPKPYPDIEIVKARIAKCIELSENRDIIRQTQRDKLTGLFNVDYFMRYVDHFDHLYKNTILDAVACNVNGLHSINRLHGRRFGDLVLRTIGMSLRKLARKIGGMGCRQTGDTFLLYCPHQENYEQLAQDLLLDVFANEEIAGEVSMRFGVFVNAQQEPNIEERFVCAKIAADKVQGTNAACGFYELD